MRHYLHRYGIPSVLYDARSDNAETEVSEGHDCAIRTNDTAADAFGAWDCRASEAQ